jgi:hypothetical protein
MKPLTILILLILVNALSSVTDDIAWNKQGGVCFRVDDNHTPSQWLDYASAFAAHGDNFDFAVNLGAVSIAQLDAIRTLIDMGNSCGDHTPNHSTSAFLMPTAQEAAAFSGMPGVDHINGTKVCLKYGALYPNIFTGETTAGLSGDTVISTAPGAFHGKGTTWDYIYFPDLNRLCQVTNVRSTNTSDPDTLTILSFWNETLNLGDNANIHFELLFNTDGSVRSDLDALRLLASRSRSLQQQLNLPPFTIWHQPGGLFPRALPCEIKAVYGDEFGYTSGSCFTDSGKKCYNEYNPGHDRQFSMQWGDFTDYSMTLSVMKKRIADGVACHRIMIGGSHFAVTLGTWPEYIQRVDSLLAWCQQKNIPVDVYNNWANCLENTQSNPNVNLWPSLSTDLDGNGVPDGIVLSHGHIESMTDIHGNTVPGFVSLGAYTVAYVNHLYGMEKGQNLISFDVKSSAPGVAKLMVYTEKDAGGPYLSLQYITCQSTTSWQTVTGIVTIPDSVNSALVSIGTFNAASTVQFQVTNIVIRGYGYPDPASTIFPSDGALIDSSNAQLQWAPGLIAPTGYILDLWNSSGVSLINNLDIGAVVGFSAQSLLTCSGVYSWRVTPYFDGNDGVRRYAVGCKIWSFSVFLPISPRTPTNVIIHYTGSQIILSWDPVTLDIQGNPISISGYRVYASSSSDFSSSDVTLFGETTTTSMIIDGSAIESTRFFRITAEYSILSP